MFDAFDEFLCRIRRLHWRLFPLVRQQEQAECGPAALLAVLRYWGGWAPLAHVRRLAGTDPAGASLLDLAQAAEALGFAATGAQGTYDNLLEASLPCIAHTRTPEGQAHFVVVVRADSREVVLADPAIGIRRLPRGEFERVWHDGIVLLLSPEEQVVRTQHPRRWQWLVGLLRHDAAWLQQSVFLGGVYTALGMLTAVFIQLMIDRFIPNAEYDLLMWAALGLAAAHGLRSVVGYVRQRFLLTLDQRLGVRIARHFLTHIFRLTGRFFDAHPTGELVARLDDAVIVQSAVRTAAANAVVDLLVVVGSVAFVFVVAPTLGWLAVLSLPAYGALLIMRTRTIHEDQSRVLRRLGRVKSSYIDGFSQVRTIRTFGVQSLFGDRGAEANEAFQDARRTLGLREAGVGSLAEFAGSMLVAATLAIGAWEVIAGALEMGAMLAAYSLFGGALPSIQRLPILWVTYQRATVALDRLLYVLQHDPEEDTGTRSFDMRRALTIKGGRFAWTRRAALLQRIDMVVRVGSITGLTGANGTGKTTLLSIIDRTYALNAGELLVDEVPATDIALADYRRHVTVVPEDVRIFDGTLKDNIELGRDVPALPATLRDLLGEEGATMFLGRFPAGWATRLGKSGRELSAGERQVVGILRAILLEPTVLVLDESTNAMDPEFRARIDRFIRRYARDHAVLMVSHDTRTLSACDRLYAIVDGEVVEILAQHKDSAFAVGPEQEHQVK